MNKIVIIGSGPGGSSAAIAFSKRGKRVLIIERGAEMKSTGGKRAFGHMLNAIKHLDDNSPSVAGGGSAINYGVVATPTLNDIENAVGSVASRKVLARFGDYLQDVGKPQAIVPSVSPAHEQIASALSKSWKISPGIDQSINKTHETRPRTSNEETLLYNACSQPDHGHRRDQLSIALQSKRVMLWANSNVECIEESGDGWVLHVLQGGKKKIVCASHVMVACGALETPRLLLASVQKGLLPRGISPHVGRHLVDHGRNEMTFLMRSGYATEKYYGIPILSSHEKTHVEILPYSGIGSLSIAASTCCSWLFGCKTSSLLNLLPNWLTIDETFSDRTFDIPCCAPCGLAAFFNPCNCVSDRMLFVIGRRTSIEGSVSIDSVGRRKTKLPGYSEDDKKAVQKAMDEIVQIVGENVPALKRKEFSTSIDNADTQWHYGGTVRMNVNADGAVDSEFKLLDGSGKSYETLFIADNSVMRTPSTFNTQTMAALFGYYAGAVASENMIRV